MTSPDFKSRRVKGNSAEISRKRFRFHLLSNISQNTHAYTRTTKVCINCYIKAFSLLGYVFYSNYEQNGVMWMHKWIRVENKLIYNCGDKGSIPGKAPRPLAGSHTQRALLGCLMDKHTSFALHL